MPKSSSFSGEFSKKYWLTDYLNNEQKLNESRITEISGKITSELIPILSDNIPSFEVNNRVIVTTWSDGRLENLPDSSNLELIIYWDKLSPELEKIVSSLFSVQLSSIKGVDIHSREIESFDLLKNKNLIEYSGNWQVFPTRFLDSKFLWWNYEKYNKLWFKFVENIKTVDKSKLKQFYKRVSYHKKIIETGWNNFKGERLVFFDKDKRVIKLYYKSWKGWLFKQWPLRLYQYTLASLICKFIRKNDLPEQDIMDLKKMPKTISNKLNYLRDKIKNFSSYEQFYKEIVDTYYYFLNLHNQSKKKFKNKDVSIKLSSDDFKIINDRLEFIKKNIFWWQLK